MIFLSGIHGAGKSYLCNDLNKYNISTYSASHLIAEYKKETYTPIKLTNDIDGNPYALIKAINSLNDVNQYVLDGHLCLLNGETKISRINSDVIIQLNPQMILNKVSDPSEIFKRLKQRDNKKYNINFLESFQNEEIQYARELSEILKIKLLTIDDDFKIDEIVKIIRRV